jgi:hypothetical protein
MKTLDEFLDQIENNAIIHFSFANGTKFESIDQDKIKAAKIIREMKEFSRICESTEDEFEELYKKIRAILNGE